MLENGTSQFEDFVARHCVSLLPGVRSMIIVNIHQVGSSCGFSVPLFDFKEHRQILNDHMAKKEQKFKAGNKNESFERYCSTVPRVLPLHLLSAPVREKN